jgi:hypothetical protein
MKNFIDRLFKSGLITTILGICILGIGVFLYISKEHNEIEAGAVCTIGLLLLRSKDSLIGISKK